MPEIIEYLDTGGVGARSATGRARHAEQARPHARLLGGRGLATSRTRGRKRAAASPTTGGPSARAPRGGGGEWAARSSSTSRAGTRGGLCASRCLLVRRRRVVVLGQRLRGCERGVRTQFGLRIRSNRAVCGKRLRARIAPSPRDSLGRRSPERDPTPGIPARAPGLQRIGERGQRVRLSLREPPGFGEDLSRILVGLDELRLLTWQRRRPHVRQKHARRLDGCVDRPPRHRAQGLVLRRPLHELARQRAQALRAQDDGEARRARSRVTGIVGCASRDRVRAERERVRRCAHRRTSRRDVRRGCRSQSSRSRRSGRRCNYRRCR